VELRDTVRRRGTLIRGAAGVTPSRCCCNSRRRPSTSSTVTVSPGWRSSPVGSAAATGSRNVMQTPRWGVVPNVTPRSTSEMCTPTERSGLYGPVTCTEAMLDSGVRRVQGP